MASLKVSSPKNWLLAAPASSIGCSVRWSVGFSDVFSLGYSLFDPSSAATLAAWLATILPAPLDAQMDVPLADWSGQQRVYCLGFLLVCCVDKLIDSLCFYPTHCLTPRLH